MQVNFNPNVNQSRTNFKANLQQARNNDALREIIEEDPLKIYTTSLALKEAPKDDIIEISKGKINYDELCKLSKDDAAFWERYSNHEQISAYFAKYIKNNEVLKTTFLATLPEEAASKLLDNTMNGEIFPKGVQTKINTSKAEYEYKAISNLSSNRFIDGIEEILINHKNITYQYNNVRTRLNKFISLNLPAHIIKDGTQQKDELLSKRVLLDNLILNKRTNFVKKLLKVK